MKTDIVEDFKFTELFFIFSVSFNFFLILGGLAQHTGYSSEYNDSVPVYIQLIS